MSRISLSEEAEADADSAIDWYIGESAFSAADDLVNEIERALRLLQKFPALGEGVMHKARSFPLHGFAYSLIYRLQGDTVRVIAVAHHSRRPGYWALGRAALILRRAATLRRRCCSPFSHPGYAGASLAMLQSHGRGEHADK